MSDDNRTQDTRVDSQTNDVPNPPDEWNELGGKAKDRIQKLAAMKNKALQEREEARKEAEKYKEMFLSMQTTQKVPMPEAFASEEERLAAQRLKELKFVTKEDLDEIRRDIEKEIRTEQDKMYLDNVHKKLEEKYAQKDGYPSYDRDEINDWMLENNNFDPEYAYEKIYRDEIIHAEANKRKSSSGHVLQTKSRISSGQPWDKESLAERLRQPDGREWYMSNRQLVNEIQNGLKSSS